MKRGRPFPTLGVLAIGSGMGALGYLLLSGGRPPAPTWDGWVSVGMMTGFVMAVSVALWATLAAAIGRRSLAVWAAVGLVSPVLGSLILLPPVSFLVVFGTPASCLVSLGVGLATGLMIGKVLQRPANPLPLAGE